MNSLAVITMLALITTVIVCAYVISKLNNQPKKGKKNVRK